ncbi:MAG TPA: hypothetical protein VKH15_12270 [Candidatus Acidoferrum sp.]|nr:hypothetical protein [Candidatus Acidoferrum sp.]
MKRQHLMLVAAGLCTIAGATTRAQLGMDFFKKPAIADIFKPVVGSGAVYETERDQKKSTLEMSVVGQESVEGKDGFWLEFGHSDPRTGGMMYGKMLVTKDDFQFHRMIFQQPGQPPMEMPMNPTAQQRSRMSDEMDKWHKVGTESITVPAGTFACEHWAKDDGKGDVWASSQVTPISLVKEVTPTNTMVLVKVITDAKDHITGAPTKFDPEAMKRQMMQQMQKQQQPNQ